MHKGEKRRRESGRMLMIIPDVLRPVNREGSYQRENKTCCYYKSNSDSLFMTHSNVTVGEV